MYPEQHNYLIHWLKKGEKAKYVDKIKLPNGRWRYFYTQAELEAYKLKRKLGVSAGELANKAKQGLHGLKEGALDVGARAIVGAAKRNNTVYDRLGGNWKTNAQDSADYANALQRQANAAKRDADTARAQAAVARRNGGKYVLDNGAVIGEKSESEWANKREHQAKDSAIRASGARQDAAGYQKQYDRSILGRAEARVKRADVRKATEATRNKLLGAASKASSKKPEGQKVGSIFRDAQGDLDRQKRERESRAKQKNSSVFKNGREELERQKAMRSKSNRPQSRKKHVTSGGTGVHKRRRIDYSRFER